MEDHHHVNSILDGILGLLFKATKITSFKEIDRDHHSAELIDLINDVKLLHCFLVFLLYKYMQIMLPQFEIVLLNMNFTDVE